MRAAKLMGQAYLGLLRLRGLHQILSHAFLLGAHPVIGPAARDGFARVWRYLRDEAGFHRRGGAEVPRDGDAHQHDGRACA